MFTNTKCLIDVITGSWRCWYQQREVINLINMATPTDR